MKTQLALAFASLSLSLNAFSAEPSIRITSFVLLQPRSPVAELCGVVTGIESGFAVARIAVDYNTNRVGNYNALVGADGRFCSVVATYYGTAQASVDVLGHLAQSAVERASGAPLGIASSR